MVHIDDFSVHFSRPRPAYRAGENVEGELHVKLSKRAKIENIKMTVYGSCLVHFSYTQKNSQHNLQTTDYTSKEEYMNLTLVLLAPPAGEKEMFLEPGEYQYPFSVPLAPQLPTSVEGGENAGYIRYIITGEIGIPWGIDKHCEAVFSVIRMLDLNQFPQLIQPISLRDDQTVKVMSSHPVACTLSLNKGGYVGGERIYFNLTVDNTSDKAIKTPCVALVQHITFTGQAGIFQMHKNTNPGKIDEHTHILCSVKMPVEEVAGGQNQTFSNCFLTVPNVAPTFAATYIGIKYFMTLTYKYKGILGSYTNEATLEVVIGTTPLNMPQQQPGDYGAVRPMMNPMQQQQMSFEPCAHTADKLQQQGGIQKSPPDPQQERTPEMMQSNVAGFVPSYPMYKDPTAN